MPIRPRLPFIETWTFVARNSDNRLSSSRSPGGGSFGLGAGGLSSPLGLTPMRRTVVLGAAVARDDFERWPILKDVRERYYFRPYHSALLVTPADAHPSPACDPAPDSADVARAVLRFETICDHRLTRIERRWAGLRTFAPDQAPVVGWSTEVEGYFWLAGLGGFGVQTAPAVGNLAASLILGRQLPSQLAECGVDPALYTAARLAA